MICTIEVKNVDGDLAVGVILSRDAIFLTAQDTPIPGVALTPERARHLANELIQLACKIESTKYPLGDSFLR